MRTFVTILVIAATTCLAQQPRTETNTNGLNNGYLWEKGSPGEKQLYTNGIADGVFLQSVVATTKTGAANSPDVSIYPKGFLVSDIVQGIDAFYKDRTNMKVPILFSYLFVVSKIKGTPQPELDAMAARFRQQASQ